MKISLITACYNSVGVIQTALDSIMAQTWQDIDYIVIDGGSTDGTQDVLREYEISFKGRMRWISEKDHGLYDAINKGIRLAVGEIVGLLNTDDFFSHSKVLENVATAFSDSTKPGVTDRRLDAVYGDVCFVNPDNLSRIVRYYSGSPFRPWMLRWGFMPPHPTFYCRREHFERLGIYSTNYLIGADYELLIRFLWHARICTSYLPGPMVVMRTGGKSTRSWKSNLILNQDIVRSCRTNGIYTNLAMLIPKYFYKIFELVRKRKQVSLHYSEDK